MVGPDGSQESSVEKLRSSLLSGATFCGLFGLLCFLGALEDEDTTSTGHFWWKDEVTKEVPSATRLGWLALAVLMFFVALILLVIVIRSTLRPASAGYSGPYPYPPPPGAHYPYPPPTPGAQNSSAIQSLRLSKEFWITTVLTAVIGLPSTVLALAALL